MSYEFCKCEHPIVDVDPDEPYRCRRCGLDATLFRIVAEGLVDGRDPVNASRHVDAITARRQERLDALEGSSLPAWGGEAGNVDVRLVATVAAVAAAVLVVVLAWHYLVAGGVLYAAYRHLTRHSRRRRPKSSWSSLATSSAALFAAWNSRWLKPSTVTRNGRPLRVSVPASVGRQHVDEDGIPF